MSSGNSLWIRGVWQRHLAMNLTQTHWGIRPNAPRHGGGGQTLPLPLFNSQTNGYSDAAVRVAATAARDLGSDSSLPKPKDLNNAILAGSKCEQKDMQLLIDLDHVGRNSRPSCVNVWGCRSVCWCIFEVSIEELKAPSGIEVIDTVGFW